MDKQSKSKKEKRQVPEDSTIEKLISQRDTANKGLEKILKKMYEKRENK